MVEVLSRCKEHGAVSVKAEFEAEGTRTDELLRLLEMAHKADIGMALKVGGCEAIRDMLAERVQVSVAVLLGCGCGRVAVAVWLWPCGCGRVAVAMWLWPCGCGHVAVAKGYLWLCGRVSK